MPARARVTEKWYYGRIEAAANVISRIAAKASSTPYKGQQHGQSHSKSERAAMGFDSLRRFCGSSAKVSQVGRLDGGTGFAIAEADGGFC